MMSNGLEVLIHDRAVFIGGALGMHGAGLAIGGVETFEDIGRIHLWRRDRPRRQSAGPEAVSGDFGRPLRTLGIKLFIAKDRGLRAGVHRVTRTIPFAGAHVL